MQNEPDISTLDSRHLWHPYTRASRRPAQGYPVIVRGQGIYLFDETGRRFTDAVSSWWACSLGHSHPRLVRALGSQLPVLQHSILGDLAHPGAARLAARLSALMPTPDRHVFFSSDGSSSVEAALKIAVQYFSNTGRPERKKILSLQNAYHGDTVGAVSVGYLEHFHRPFLPLLFEVGRLEAPVASGPSPDQALRALSGLLAERAQEIAALIVEPLCLGSAGMLMYPAQWLADAAALCRNHGVLFIADEIATGFGRTGKLFAFNHAGLDPDIVCLGKGLTGGAFPLSAAVVRDGIYTSFTDLDGPDRTFYHGHTFGGSPLGCACALEALDVMRDENIVEESARKGRVLAARLENPKKLPFVREVRCLGLIGAVELDSAQRAQTVRKTLFDRGILVRPLGPVVYLMPPLVITDDELGTLCDGLCAGLSACAD